MRGLYIHIPFCKSKCPYCDFYSAIPKDDIVYEYCQSLLQEMKTGVRTSEFTANSDLSFDTVYFGGGTPSLIGGVNIDLLLKAARKNYHISDDAEITVECNPSTVNEDFFREAAYAGVNRISLGMQSAVDNERRALGRFADRDKISDCIVQAKKYGITNISLDVMLGVPLQTPESLNETLDFCIESGVPHISAYMLSIEENTVFYKRRNSLQLPNEDSVCDMYLDMCEKLEKNGMVHYEISNFAKSGFESRHNLKYWNCEEYLGLGPSAHSFINGKRFFFKRSTQNFINGEKAVFDSFGGSEEEYIMLRLRLGEGLDNEIFKERFGKNISEKILKKADKFIKSGHMTYDDRSLSLTHKGMLISNHIIINLLY